MKTTNKVFWFSNVNQLFKRSEAKRGLKDVCEAQTQAEIELLKTKSLKSGGMKYGEDSRFK